MQRQPLVPKTEKTGGGMGEAIFSLRTKELRLPVTENYMEILNYLIDCVCKVQYTFHYQEISTI